jgi:hypothetical protein
MKLFLVPTIVFVGSIWKNKSGWFLFVMSLGLSVAAENLLLLGSTAADFQPMISSKSTLHHTTEPMKLFLVPTMVFVGSIWKNKSGWFLFVMSLGLSVATENLLTAEVQCAIADFRIIPMICFKSTLHHTTEPMKLFLVPTMVFAGSIWKNKSG